MLKRRHKRAARVQPDAVEVADALLEWLAGYRLNKFLAVPSKDVPRALNRVKTPETPLSGIVDLRFPSKAPVPTHDPTLQDLPGIPVEGKHGRVRDIGLKGLLPPMDKLLGGLFQTY